MVLIPDGVIREQFATHLHVSHYAMTNSCIRGYNNNNNNKLGSSYIYIYYIVLYRHYIVLHYTADGTHR